MVICRELRSPAVRARDSQTTPARYTRGSLSRGCPQFGTSTSRATGSYACLADLHAPTAELSAGAWAAQSVGRGWQVPQPVCLQVRSGL